jgi:hypothetical protein
LYGIFTPTGAVFAFVFRELNDPKTMTRRAVFTPVLLALVTVFPQCLR